MHNSFSLKRLGLLLRRDFHNIRRTGLIVMGIGFCLLFITFYVSLSNELMGHRNGNPNFNYFRLRMLFDLFSPLFLVTGFALTSIAYSDLIRIPQAQAYLSLPATLFEKWLSKWILTALVFPVIFIFLYQVFSWLCYAVGQSMELAIITVPIFDVYIWKIVGYYIVFQSIFLLGAVSLPKISFFKTLAVGIGLLSGGLLIANLVLWMIKPELANNAPWQFDFSFPNWRIPYDQQYFLNHQLVGYLIALFAVLFFPIIAFISYLKLKEREA